MSEREIGPQGTGRPAGEDFEADLAIGILHAAIEDLRKPLTLTKEATEAYQRHEFRLSAIEKLRAIQGMIDQLTRKLKAGV